MGLSHYSPGPTSLSHTLSTCCPALYSRFLCWCRQWPALRPWSQKTWGPPRAGQRGRPRSGQLHIRRSRSKSPSATKSSCNKAFSVHPHTQGPCLPPAAQPDKHLLPSPSEAVPAMPPWKPECLGHGEIPTPLASWQPRGPPSQSETHVRWLGAPPRGKQMDWSLENKVLLLQMQAEAADIGYSHNKSASYIRHLTRPSKLGIWNFTTQGRHENKCYMGNRLPSPSPGHSWRLVRKAWAEVTEKGTTQKTIWRMRENSQVILA